MASDPWQGHNSTALFTLVLTVTPTLIGLTTYLCSRMTPSARRRRTPVRTWRDVSLAAIALGLALYLWGLLHILFTDDRAQAQECERRRPDGIPALVGRRGDFVPLRLVCEASDGHDYSVVVPGYINPSLVVLLLLALIAAAASVLLHHKRRKHHKQHTSTRKEG
ncbi:hypothetical protein [Streptomyces sp. NPDC048002]|uniref:hypothetical protein n=1 Tax=Streptomyces sp. NPDC048002 TaxID=3154344 RepID=UPI0033E143B7